MAMSTPTSTLRLRPALRARIERMAKRARRSFSEVTQDLLDEALRMRECPGIYFADEPAGREAKIAGTGLGIWEVIRDYVAAGKEEGALRASFPWLSACRDRPLPAPLPGIGGSGPGCGPDPGGEALSCL